MQPGEANRFSTLSKAVAAQRTRLHSLAKVLRPKDSATDQRDRVGYLMVLPYILHIAVFLGYPLAFAFVLIFHRWNIYTPMKWVGLGNIKLLLTDRRYAMPAIAIMATWKNVGLYVVLFLVGLQAIPIELYEAAELDGASAWQKFRLITVPMLNPTIMLVLVLSTIGGFSLFIEPYVMTGGGPANSTLSGILYLYKQAFFFSKMGYATTIGFFWAMLIFVVVLLQRRFVETEAV